MPVQPLKTKTLPGVLLKPMTIALIQMGSGEIVLNTAPANQFQVVINLLYIPPTSTINVRHFHIPKALYIAFSGCETISGPQEDKICTFPFVYKQVQYNACTTIENEGMSWCSTETDDNNTYIDGKWGNCAEHCPGKSLFGSS